VIHADGVQHHLGTYDTAEEASAAYAEAARRYHGAFARSTPEMRIQSSHGFDQRGLDAYWTCPEAIEALIALEGDQLPRRIWEPAAGDGAIVKPLRASSRIVHASDIAEYGLPGCHTMDYLSAPTPPTGWADGIITNPPYKLAQEFANGFAVKSLRIRGCKNGKVAMASTSR
jgi:hypothetical protein